MYKKNLDKLFNPKSIAVLGASRDEKKIGHIVLKNIVNSGFRGKIYPINPKAISIAGMDCYAGYNDLPEIPDMAILALPAEVAMTLLDSIAKKGTKNIIIFSAGFKEAGQQGEQREIKLRAAAEKYKLNILGPNCLGFVSTPSSLNATFSEAGGTVGNLRFISQSGALASGIFDWAKHHQVAFSEFITLGNKAVLNENDILHYWSTQIKNPLSPDNLSSYRPIGMYLESIDDGKEFLKLVSKISVTDPVFILKPGKSKNAQQAIHSHTGSMAGDDAVQEIAFKEAGMIRCDGLEDMFDLSKIFSWVNAPKGPKVAIVSNAGGPAVISTDALEKEGLQMANLSAKTHKKLKEKLPREANILNPVDVLGDALANRYGEAVNDVLAEEGVDALLVILTPQVMTEIEATAEIIGRLAKKHGKPVVCSFIGGDMVDKGEQVLNKFKIPSFRFPERAIKALARMWQWQEKVQSLKSKVKGHTKVKPLATSIINKINRTTESAKKESRKMLTILESDKVLNLCGIKTPKSAAVKNFGEAEKFASVQGWPVVLKISSEVMLHKTEQGGVVINIDNPVKLAGAWKKISQISARLPKKPAFSINIQKQTASGVEVIVGVKYDESFGNILMVGAGGLLAELVADNRLKLLPISEKGIEELLSETKVYLLLKGFRGHKPYALKKLTGLIVKLSALVESNPRFKEITINPVIVGEKEAVAVDTRIIL